METNIAYIYFGWVGIVLGNMFYLWILLKAYDTSRAANSFIALTALVWISSLRIYAVFNNFKLGAQVKAGEITTEMVQATTTAAKIDYHFTLIFFGLVTPVLMTLLIFYLFKLDYKIERKCQQK